MFGIKKYNDGVMHTAVVSLCQCVKYAGCPKIGVMADTGKLASSVIELGTHSCSFCVRL